MKNKYHEEQPIYESRSRRKRKKKSNWLPYTLLFLAFIIAAVAGALFASSSLFDKNTTENKDNLMVAKDKVMVMIMGVDEREGDVGRSDTLLIATLDPKKRKAALLSIPRDTRVKIKGHGFDKINAAYAYGGHQLTENTIENLMGVDVEHYVIINIKAFHKIIDAIGGAIHHIGNVHKYARPEDVPEHTMFIITTDGMENASHNFSSDEVKKMIERQKEKYGWEFIFVAANIDAVETAKSFGISEDRAVNYHADKQGTACVYNAVSDAVCAVRACAPLRASWKDEIDRDYKKRK